MEMVHGQNSFTLATRSVHAVITRFGGMLAPVTFFADSAAPLQPYSIAPWATEPPLPTVPPLVSALRGDFLCSAFGDNVEAYAGRPIPPHGDTTNGEWSFVHQRTNELGTALRLAIELPTQGGRCIGTTLLLERHQFVYQRHDFEDIRGLLNPGHHAMLNCPQVAQSARLSFSPHVFISSSPTREALPDDVSSSRLVSGATAERLTAMKGVNGARVDVTVFPTYEAFDDVFLVCTKPECELAWSAATFAAKGYAWLALRRVSQLPSTLVWLSNGGRSEAPWNGRHKPIIGLEDIMGYFACGLAESARDNSLTALGIPTRLQVEPGGALRIPYIQGVVRIPPQFDRVASVEPIGPGMMLARASSGAEVRFICQWEFLDDPDVSGLCEP